MSETSIHKKKTRRDAGFTLVEAMIVLAIIGLIMQLVGPRVMNYWSEAKMRSATVQAERLASALELFYLDTGRYPTASEGLKALMEPPGKVVKWNGPYIKGNSLPVDPWGQAYIYKINGTNGPFEVSFRQPDGREVSDRRRQTAGQIQ